MLKIVLDLQIMYQDRIQVIIEVLQHQIMVLIMVLFLIEGLLVLFLLNMGIMVKLGVKLVKIIRLRVMRIEVNFWFYEDTNQVNGYGQPVVNSRNTYNVEEAKGNPIANVCFGLLGLIALVSLILGILFAVGVIGNKGTDVDASVNSKGVSTNTHFRNIQHEFVEES